MEESIAPVITTLNAPFWAAAAEGELILPWCVQTSRAFWPPSPVSPFVTGGAVTWRPASPFGVLRACVLYRRVFQRALEPVMPYGIGLVAMQAGIRLQAHVPLHPSRSAPSIGAMVEIGLRPILPGAPRVPTIIGLGTGDTAAAG